MYTDTINNFSKFTEAYYMSENAEHIVTVLFQFELFI